MVEGNVVKLALKKNVDGTRSIIYGENLDEDYTTFYVSVLGDWTTPDPDDLTTKIGFNLHANGEATGINMKDVNVTNWKFNEDGSLTFEGTKLVNGHEVAMNDTVYINMDEEPYTLSFKHNRGFMYTKVEKD